MSMSCCMQQRIGQPSNVSYRNSGDPLGIGVERPVVGAQPGDPSEKALVHSSSRPPELANCPEPGLRGGSNWRPRHRLSPVVHWRRMVIDTSFDFRTDACGKDPDAHSPTLRRYHKL